MVLKTEKPVNCTVVGDAMIGKSTLVQSFMDQQLSLSTPYVATVVDTYKGCLSVAGQKHNLNILDNAGQHDYKNTRTCSYKDSEVLVLCYSVVDRESLASIKEFWVPEVTNRASRRKPIILVATQTDLRKQHNIGHIQTEEGESLAKEIGAEAFLECSAYDKQAVNHVFLEITTSGINYRKRKHNIVSRIFGK